MELNNIRLLVNDFQKCFEFYKNTLGLEVTYGTKEGPYASFELGELSQLTLFQSEMMAQTIGTEELPKPKNVQDKFVIVIEADDVDDEFERLSVLDINFVNPPMDMQAWGIRVSHLRDPENNLIELFSELPENDEE